MYIFVVLFFVMPKNKRKSTDNTKIEDFEATASTVSISSATLQHLLTAQAESNASMLEQQAKSNADLLERLLAKFPTSLDTASPSDTDPSTPMSKIKVPKCVMMKLLMITLQSMSKL